MCVFNKMHNGHCRPNVVPYSSLHTHSHTGGHWEKAAEFFTQMSAAGCKPDAITYSALISAYERGGQWRRALKAFEQMQVVPRHHDVAAMGWLMMHACMQHGSS